MTYLDSDMDSEILERYSVSLDPDEMKYCHYVAEFLTWRCASLGDSGLSGDDDVDLRSCFLDLRMRNVSQREHKEQISALRNFYSQLKSEELIEHNPFVSFNFSQPYLTRTHIRRRREIYPEKAEERQIKRLEMLIKLAEGLNRAPDMNSALEVVLQTILQLMDLQTAWACLFPDPAELVDPEQDLPTNDFVLGSAYGLPPALERQNRYYLCPPYNCHCLMLMRKGQMQCAVNIVECTRLLESAEADGDTKGLFFHASVPLIASGQPLGIMNVATEEWQFLTAADLQLLSGIGAQVATALERSTLYDINNAQRMRLEQELNLAREVQRSLLPQQLPEIPGFHLAAEWYSAREMAGDFYDVFRLPDGRWGLVIADVADKGAPAALYMAMTSSLIRSSANFYLNPAETLKEVNRRIISHSSSDMFVNAFYGVLDAAGRKLTYASAGHNPALLRRCSGLVKLLPPTGAAIGVFEHFEIKEECLDLAQGDMLVAYTDGITEAFNPEGEQYGIERLIQVIQSASLGDAKTQIEHISRDLNCFTRDSPQMDDITMMVLVC